MQINVNGVEIHYVEEGEGPAVVCVHGWPTDSGLWRAQLPALAERHRAIALDLPGFGQSGKPADVRYTTDFQAHALAGFLDALGLDRVTLVCHDLGGMVALLFAVRHPERVERLVVLDTIPYPDASLMLAVFMLAGRLPGVGWALTTRRVFRSLFRLATLQTRAAAVEVADRYYAPFAGDAAARTVLRRTLLEPDISELREIASKLDRLRMPTLILWAAKDALLPPAIGRRLHADLPGSQFELVPDANHFLTEDRPDFVAERLVRFLAETPVAPASAEPALA